MTNMTNPNEIMQSKRTPEGDAFRAIARVATAAGLAAALVLAPLTLSGCGEEEEAPVAVAPPPPPPPPPPPAPTVTPIAQLMKELGISDKIRLPEDKAPKTDPERVAVLKFFDGFAKSKPEAIRAAMGPQDVAVLDAMKSGGEFEKACAPVTRIDLTTTNREGKAYVMAVYRAGSDIEAQLWAFKATGEGKKVETQLFESYVQPVDIMSKISGSNLIGEWVKVVDADRKVALEPDETVKPTARVQEQEKPEASGSGEESGPIGAPPMRNKPPPGGIDRPGRGPGK